MTLRGSAVDEVAALAAECGLHAIEWGADVHVPPEDASAIARARAASEAAGCRCSSYGSYLFAAGLPGPDEVRAVLDTAVALGAPTVRVWAGFGVRPGSHEYDGLVAALVAASEAAAARHLHLGLEFHGGTATATVAGALALLDDVGRPNLFTYWQPPYWRAPTTSESDAAEVRALGDRLLHLHVYEWAAAEDRRPLDEGAARWAAVLAAAGDGDRVAYLEFVAGDDPAALRRDAATLHTMLATAP